jgi:Ni/Fe-hydrogenase subunit HybB-like protein
MLTSSNNIPSPAGYTNHVITKTPEWHTLVVFDVLFNNLATGMFLVAAVAELAAPQTFTAVSTVAYPVALVLLLIDLAMLVLDLGDPLRFHHMLRVFKPRSPMSFGTWCLTAFSFALTAILAVELAATLGWVSDSAGLTWWVREIAIVLGLPLAFGSAAYKGVLFSTTAQPGWKQARWMGGYLVNSAVMLGCAELLALALVMGQTNAANVLRMTLAATIPLNLLVLALLVFDVRDSLKLAMQHRDIGRRGALAIGGGLVVPTVLLVLGGTILVSSAVFLVVLGALIVRAEIVHFPHVLSRGGSIRPH